MPEREAVPGCTGQCCAVFTIKPGDLLAKGLHGDAEDFLVLNMLIPLMPEDVGPRLRGLGYASGEDYGDSYGPWARSDGGEGVTWFAFTCRHWDEETRRCGIYAERPTMCRRFPNGETCRGCGCAGGTGS